MDGFLFIDKPVGLTSHDVVSRIKRKFKLDKVGHTGTLDPFASGLLILCLGKATKLAYLFSDLDKSYEGTISFGKHFDTFDTTGKVLKHHDVLLHEADIKEKMKTFIGGYEQIPPMYSALKIDGQKLYDLARKGEEVEREARTVEINRFEMTSPYEHHAFKFVVDVSKGTYIRSLAVDLATKLDAYAALSELRRLSVGKYHVKDAKTIEDVSLEEILKMEDFFMETPFIELNDYMIKLVKNGVYLDERQIKTDAPFIVKDHNQNMIAYYTPCDGYVYRPVVIF
ncbi:MAG: tRNA pseudouridine(55) synthase TruB [Tenericutes bacterium GWC2_34_14]|nr:MAG: tRNA pseudouridine(55) synthase TruB [Tenericutes bacterium GWA2_35_7]OHE29528.1 MAG: tRNA pseudouridine(55) synthase TruB [Tenericutes bacterium GWC2_34_14]OHE34624.1 MAG: tRNA pseudouridine(55) synthase TruB [Tenericutes bacterium GWE2_34_108]OHE35981.1 MAG: tRNA pseudouridine(55) synthase TruB [Tenericutes bacterium GWF1_35_14]OHE38933.1 MAG: tRNA pseudouridine(55) synthase TruB [Tenericutes bacterium GWF2_35_184]OHE42585.1 MAG: tRNA pseudouridine(55) synthase TruB [Tenericutes bact